MSEYHFEKKRKRRGDHCISTQWSKELGRSIDIHCGCGGRNPPPKKDKARILRRVLQRNLKDMIYE